MLTADGIPASERQDMSAPGRTSQGASGETFANRLSQYDQVLLNSPVPAIVYDAENLQILEGNDGALKLYGLKREQLCALRVNQLSPAELERSPDLVAALSKPVNVVGPLPQLGPEGCQIIVRMVIFSLAVRGVDARMAMLQDETEQRRAEEAMRASEERYRDLFENANDIIFLHDLKGRLLAVNRAAETLSGYSREEILGQDFALLLAPEARQEMQDSIRAHLGGSATQHYELPIFTKNGVQRFLEVSTRILYQRGHPVAVQGIGRDITERKLSEQRLLESARELQQKNEDLSTALRLAREATQLKEQFLANTSHELRTPMNGIMGMINLLRDTPLDGDQLDYVDAVSQCANDLLRIINDLLDMSQIEAGRMSISEDQVDIRESVNAVVKMLRLKAAAKGLTLRCKVEPDVPHEITADSVRFRQILINLVANAIKFTQSGSIDVHVRVGDTREQICCTVADTGIGVDTAVQDKIFEAFFQADGTMRRRYGGTGLGLTISKQLVEIMGGRIGTFNNDPGPGATFWFELPIRTAMPVQAG